MEEEKQRKAEKEQKKKFENLKQKKKVAQGRKKINRKRAPDRNFVRWDEKTFQRLVTASPERLTSQFQVSHGMLLNVLSRTGNGCRAEMSVAVFQDGGRTREIKREGTIFCGDAGKFFFDFLQNFFLKSSVNDHLVPTAVVDARLMKSLLKAHFSIDQ